MARNRKQNILTKWTADVNGHTISFEVYSDHTLTASEMRDRVLETRALEDDLRSGAKPMITTPHDATHETPAYVLQSLKSARMERGSISVGNSQYLDTQIKRANTRIISQPYQVQQARASVDYDWHGQMQQQAPVVRQPEVGDRFSIGVAPWRITDVFYAFGQCRFTAKSQQVDGPQMWGTFERIGNNQWRAFQQSDAPMFAL